VSSLPVIYSRAILRHRRDLHGTLLGTFDGLLGELIAKSEISQMKRHATASEEDKEELRQLMRVLIQEARERSPKEK
jgi:hypothetical protein